MKISVTGVSLASVVLLLYLLPYVCASCYMYIYPFFGSYVKLIIGYGAYPITLIAFPFTLGGVGGTFSYIIVMLATAVWWYGIGYLIERVCKKVGAFS